MAIRKHLRRVFSHIQTEPESERLHVVASALHTPEIHPIEHKVAELVGDERFNKELVDEITRLRQNIIDVKAGFSAVRADLYKFDAQCFVDQNKKQLRLHDKWVEYEKNFLQLVNTSQSMATCAATMLEDIAWTILDPDDKTLEVSIVLEELESLKSRVAEEEQAASKLRLDFESLATAIQAYADHIKTTASAVHCDDSEVVENMRKALDAAREILEETRDKMRSLMATTVLSAVLGSGMLVLACLLCPGIAVPAFGAIMAASKTGVEFWEARSLANNQQQVVNELSAELKKEEDKLKWIKQYTDRMSHTEEIIGDMSAKVYAISHIWLFIQQDLVKLTQYIKTLVPEGKREIKLGTMWNKRMAKCRDSVEALIPMLNAYAIEASHV